jgi:hypothetical protein
MITDLGFNVDLIQTLLDHLCEHYVEQIDYKLSYARGEDCPCRVELLNDQMLNDQQLLNHLEDSKINLESF